MRKSRTGESPVVSAKNKTLRICCCTTAAAELSKFSTATFSTMTSFRDARNLVLESYDDDLIDDDEFLLLYEANKSKNPEFPYGENGRFNLEKMDDSECKAEFRFRKNDIHLLAEVLGIPDKFICYQGTRSDGIEGLCMLLKRLTYPCRYSDMICPRFERPVPVLCMISNKVLDFIFNQHGHRLTQWNDTLLNNASLERYAEAISNRGSALDNCFGFIDGTVRPICRPGELQRTVYNGHKRVHALKFQSVTLPNGMIANMYGPVGKLGINSNVQKKLVIFYVFKAK